jgi:hypothetical protein
MAFLGPSLHEPSDVLGQDTKLVLQNTSRPKGQQFVDTQAPLLFCPSNPKVNEYRDHFVSKSKYEKKSLMCKWAMQPNDDLLWMKL